MKNNTLILAGFCLFLIVAACKGDQNVDTKDAAAEDPIGCFYSYNPGTSNFEWTAYKTSDKVPVKGGFNEITVKSEGADDGKAVIESITFSMKTASVETNDVVRNATVAKHFFETINSPTIDGRIKSLGSDNKAIISVTMNGVEVDINGEYTLENGDFKFTSSVDVSAWNAMNGITTLNKECKDLHTGPDGTSKLWSEVALSFSTSLKSDCD